MFWEKDLNRLIKRCTVGLIYFYQHVQVTNMNDLLMEVSKR